MTTDEQFAGHIDAFLLLTLCTACTPSHQTRNVTLQDAFFQHHEFRITPPELEEIAAESIGFGSFCVVRHNPLPPAPPKVPVAHERGSGPAQPELPLRLLIRSSERHGLSEPDRMVTTLHLQFLTD